MASKKFYMVHWHKAKRAGLHWDLRLEYDGVLKSWAIPKGMPVHGGRHLAIKVTDHSLSYGKWEGTIKSGYGAGEVKIDTSGQYETLEKTKKSWKFKILSGKYKGTWRLTYWKEDKWLISKSGGGYSQSYSAEEEDFTCSDCEGQMEQWGGGDWVCRDCDFIKCKECGDTRHIHDTAHERPMQYINQVKEICPDCLDEDFDAEDNTQIAAQFNNSQMSHKCRGCGTVLREDEMYSPDSPDDPDALIVCRECYMGHFAAESEKEENICVNCDKVFFPQYGQAACDACYSDRYDNNAYCCDEWSKPFLYPCPVCETFEYEPYRPDCSCFPNYQDLTDDEWNEMADKGAHICTSCGNEAATYGAEEEDEIPEDVQKWLDENNMVAVPDEEIVENFENANAMYEDLFEQINRQEQQAIIQAQQDKIDAEPVLIDTRTVRDRGFPNLHLRTQRWRTPEYDWPAKPKDLEYRSYSFARSGKTYEDIEFRMGIFDEWGQKIGFETAYAPIRVRHSLYAVPRGKCARIDCEEAIRKGDLITWQGKGTQKHLSCWPRGVQAIVSEVLSRRQKPLMKAEEWEADTAIIEEVFCNDCLWGGAVTELISARDKYGPYDGCPQCKSDNLQGIGPYSTKFAENITEKQFRDYARKNPKVANTVDTDDVKFLTKGVLLGAVGGILIGTLSTVFGNIWSEFWLDLHRKNGGEYQKGGES